MAAVCVYILHHLSSSMTNVTLYRRLECWTLSRSRTRKIFIPRNSKHIVKIYSLRHLWEKSRDNRVSNARTGHFMVADDETLAEYIKFLRKSSHEKPTRQLLFVFAVWYKRTRRKDGLVSSHMLSSTCEYRWLQTRTLLSTFYPSSCSFLHDFSS